MATLVRSQHYVVAGRRATKADYELSVEYRK